MFNLLNPLDLAIVQNVIVGLKDLAILYLIYRTIPNPRGVADGLGNPQTGYGLEGCEQELPLIL